MSRLISSAVASSKLGIFADLIADEFEDIDLSPIMIYLVDTVSPEALPFLASQFDVEGFKGYDQCSTNEQKRELIKNAIYLHKHLGTISSIRKACSLIGLDPKSIEENVPLYSGGKNLWCAFRIRLSVEDLGNFNSNDLTLLKLFIDYYKNARSILTEIFFDLDLSDTIFPENEEDREELILEGTLNTVGDYSLDYGYDYN